MKRSILIRTLKTASAALLAIVVSNFLKLEYASAAGIIAILNVFETRRSTLTGGLKRTLSAIIALLIGGVLFEIFAYKTWVFGLYLLIFVPISFLLKIQLGLGPSSVLVTHLLAFKTINSSIILNELALVFIGTGFALLTNFYAPNSQKYLINLVKDIDGQIKYLLDLFGRSLKSDIDIKKESEKIEVLEEDIARALEIAQIEEDNMVMADSSLLYDLRLRRKELDLIKTMYKDLEIIPPEYSESEIVGDLLIETASKLDKKNQIDSVGSKIDYYKEHIETMALPKNHLEFKIRANVFQVFRSIEEFVDISDYIVNKPKI